LPQVRLLPLHQTLKPRICGAFSLVDETASAQRLVPGLGYVYETSGGPQTLTVTPSGGISFSGAATKLRGRLPATAGGLSFAGAATVTSQQVHSRTVTPAGGIAFGGAAAFVRTCSRVVSGGIHFSGAAAVEFGNAFAAVTNWIINARRRGRR
jgi:hypothetical protein